MKTKNNIMEKIFEICKNYQRRYQVAVIVAHHSDLLGLFQNLIDFLHATIENDVGLGRVFNLLEQRPLGRSNGEIEIYAISLIDCYLPEVRSVGQLAHRYRKLRGTMCF